ncbi:MAG: malate synthase G, partial [Candidatus Puniceispirillaceae bacterium]
MGYIVQGNLSVDAELLAFVNDVLLPAASIDPSSFWAGFDESVHKLAPRNAELLETREKIQAQIDKWLIDNRAAGLDINAYTDFLKEIGYLVPEG